MKKQWLYLVVCLIVTVMAGTASAQDWRGTSRIQGMVVGPDGKAMSGAKVILRSPKGNDGPDPVVTDRKGRWAFGGLRSGQWNIDIEAEGFLTRKLSAAATDTVTQPMKVVLEAAPPPAPVQQEEEAPTATSVQVGGVEVAPEIAQALEAANGFMKTSQWKEAAAEYEKALTVLSDNAQLKFALARAYYGAGELKKALVRLREVYDADTGNTTAAMLLANMLIEDGEVEEGKKILDALPEGAVTDPIVFVNVGILLLNKNKPEDAYTYFDRSVKIAPETAAGYYYRALASLQLKKMPAARADLQKVLSLAAQDSEEAKDARELLAQMK